MSKKENTASALLFIVFLSLFFVLNLFLPKRSFSEKENRYLQTFPPFSFASLQKGEFTSRIEDYCSDHFTGRDLWISLKARLELLQGKQANNGIFLCSGGRLVEPFTEPGSEETQRRADSINSFSEQVTVPVILGLIPTSAELYSELLPSGVRNDSQKEFIASVYSSVDVPTAGILDELIQHKNDYLFYRTDHHWTTEGASRAYSALAAVLQIPERRDYHVRTVSDSFLGTSYSSSGFFWVRPDSIETYIDVDQDITVERYEDDNAENGDLYDTAMLDTKDKYRFFLGGNCPRIVIRTGKDALPSLLIIRDSYADSLVPFFLEDFSQIHLLDLRYYREPVGSYITDNGIDIVLILYSTANFLSDNSIMLLNR